MQDASNASYSPTMNRRMITLFHAMLFVLGFSAVFIIGWGGAATLAGQLFGYYKSWIGRIGGIVVILLGLSTLGLLRLPWMMYRDTRPHWTPGRGGPALSSVMMGVFFAAGWTPCIGTTLAAILTLGFSQNTSGQAMLLTSGYALGLGIPFLLIGFGMDQATYFIRRFRRYIRRFEQINGLLLIGIGLLMLTNKMIWISIWAQRNGLFLDLPFGKSAEPTYIIAILAGLLSFLSPCVLPLVPAYVGFLSGKVIHQVSD
ncbi:MAG TPA: cytochrome c biogenesis protein CcdA [Anaerolineales bacterium]|nr:cytochrome c biogenesis protein CcdA [Anaerolineales bacterium]